MSEHKGTPGPWRANNTGYVYGPDCVVAKCGDFAIKELVQFNADRWNADARLIAAAPRMAEENERLRTALKSILELDGTNDLPDAWDIATKATGGTDGK